MIPADVVDYMNRCERERRANENENRKRAEVPLMDPDFDERINDVIEEIRKQVRTGCISL